MRSWNNGEERGSVDGDGGESAKGGVVSDQKNEKDGGNLKHGGHLAHETWTDLWMVTAQEHDKKPYEDDEISSDDDNSQPTRKNLDDGKRNERSREKEFIGDRIEISSQFGLLVSHACDEAVDSIRDPCARKSDEGPVKEFIDDEDNEDRNQQNPNES